MPDRIKITINGAIVEAADREPLIDVLRREGIYVPTLCHHDRLEPYGVCRVCMVKVSWGRKSKYVTSCNYPVENGDVFDSESEDVLKVRNMSIEALLGRCPNEKSVVEFASRHGISKSRFQVQKPGGDDCILCGLCVRVCDEIVGARALGFMSRGPEREVCTPFMENPESCIGCGVCSTLCPTTAMKMEGQKTAILKSRHGDVRPCRYALMGFYPGGVCANSYECWRCDVDQKFRELAAMESCEHPIFLAREYAGSKKGGGTE
jgi:NADH dehydrogenase/NADH:ubiquinone oxidoreductase subunit G